MKLQKCDLTLKSGGLKNVISCDVHQISYEIRVV